jgi:hypothetical protein
MGEKEFNKIKDAISVAQASDSLSSGDTTLQSHGKFLGMDAFSWHNPNAAVLDKTIESFPFKTLWLGNASEVNQYIGNYDKHGCKVEQYLIYGVPQDIVKKQKHITYFESVSKAIQNLDNFKLQPGILLFTASDSDSPYSIKYFSSLFSQLI